jgi:hypothetical protein
MKILLNVSLSALPFVVCDAAGRILRTGSAPGQMIDLQAQSGELVFAGTAGPNDFISDPTGAAEAVPRPASPVTIDKTTVQADATDAVMLSNVGAGATVSVTGPVSSSGTGDGTPISLTFEAAGQYSITVQHFPDLDFVAVVNAI